MNLSSDVIDRKVTGATTGVPQILLNYAPVGRGPWRLKALIDRTGHPVTSRFITVRPRAHHVPLEYLWAVLNSPIANAYAYTHLMKRDILVGTMRLMPIPAATAPDMERIAVLAANYLDELAKAEAAFGNTLDPDQARRQLMAIDAEILRLYDLAPRLERQVLDLFAGQQRAGVTFPVDRYYPAHFEPWVRLHEYLSDDYRRSTAGALREAHQDLSSEPLLAALRRATEDFRE